VRETVNSEESALAAELPGPARGDASPTRRRLSTARRGVPAALLSPQGFLLALILVLSVETALRSEYFLTQANLENIGRQIAVVGILASGTTLLMLTGLIDLSIGAVSALVGLLATKLVLDAGLPFGVAALAAVCTSVLLAAAMGFVIARTKVAAFMLTLGVWTAVTGVDLLLQGEFPITLPPGDQYTVLGQGELGGAIPYSVLICVVLWIMTGAAMRWSSLLHQAKAVGSNEEAARLSGIRTDRIKVIIFALNGLIVGIAGVVLLSRLGSAAYDSGDGLEIQTIAAVVLGGAVLEGGRASIVGSALGVILIGVISNSLNLQQIAGEWQLVIYGSIIVAAVIGREVRAAKTR
jgi:ribose transport system permease protein